jgi:multiple antibiotic resistance protein
MDNAAVHFFTVFMAFFAIMNPIANASLFLGLTQDCSDADRRLIALKSVTTAFIIVSVFAIAGREIFSIFGITLPAFKIAGGAMIGLIGYHMLQGERSSLHSPSADASAPNPPSSPLALALTPLGIPVLAGPGTIATAMNFAAGSSLSQIAYILLAFGLMCLVTYLAFITCQRLALLLGQNGINVISKLMGLILTVVGVQMIIDGVLALMKTG